MSTEEMAVAVHLRELPTALFVGFPLRLLAATFQEHIISASPTRVFTCWEDRGEFSVCLYRRGPAENWGCGFRGFYRIRRVSHPQYHAMLTAALRRTP